MSGHILFSIEGAVATITINRPQARNAFTLDMYRELKQRIDMASADHQLRALILTGAGNEAFAAGTDIGEFRSFASPDDAAIIHVSGDHHVPMVLNRPPQFRFSSGLV